MKNQNKCPFCFSCGDKHTDDCIVLKSGKIKEMSTGFHTWRDVDPKKTDNGGLSGKHAKIDKTKNVHGDSLRLPNNERINWRKEYDNNRSSGVVPKYVYTSDKVGRWEDKVGDGFCYSNNGIINHEHVPAPLGNKLKHKRAGTFDRFNDPIEHNNAVGVLMELFGRGMATKNYNMHHDLILYITHMIEGLRKD